MKKILLIEDDQIVANVYSNKLVVGGFQVEIANDGRTGLQLTTTYKPDLIILDLMLPDISGVEIMKDLRARPGLEKLPIIVFSNTYLSNVMKEAWKAGASKCFSKASCTPKQILEAIHSLLDNTPDTTPAAPAPQPEQNTPAPTIKLKTAAPNTPTPTAPAPSPTTPPSDNGEQFRKEFPTIITTIRIVACDKLCRACEFH